jgi:putative zinc finger/helix-turn-helix YgiT family protein
MEQPKSPWAHLPPEIDCGVCLDGVADRVEERRPFSYRRRSVVILDDFYRCRSCGEEVYVPEQLDQVEQRAKAAIEEADTVRPEAIRAIRERLGLTQFQFEALLGVGRNTVVRWESGKVRPNGATNTLLRLLDADPRNAERLAEWQKVELGSAA